MPSKGVGRVRFWNSLEKGVDHKCCKTGVVILMDEKFVMCDGCQIPRAGNSTAMSRCYANNNVQLMACHVCTFDSTPFAIDSGFDIER